MYAERGCRSFGLAASRPRNDESDYIFPSALSTRSGVIGISTIGAALERAERIVDRVHDTGRRTGGAGFAGALGPSSEWAVGVTTWPTSMSGISPAIGTR